LEVGCRAPANTSWVLPGELQLDVRVQDLGGCSAARISIRGAQELIQIATIGHRVAFFLSNRCFAAAILRVEVGLADADPRGRFEIVAWRAAPAPQADVDVDRLADTPQRLEVEPLGERVAAVQVPNGRRAGVDISRGDEWPSSELAVPQGLGVHHALRDAGHEELTVRTARRRLLGVRARAGRRVWSARAHHGPSIGGQLAQVAHFVAEGMRRLSPSGRAREQRPEADVDEREVCAQGRDRAQFSRDRCDDRGAVAHGR
jgi:hypothetical protein